MHPKWLLGPDDLALLEIWQAWRGSDFARGHLPFAGGAAEQPACVIAALEIMEATAQALRPANG